MALTKADIVATIYGQGLLSKADASRIVETVLGIIKQSLIKDNEMLLSGFGKWGIRAKAPRTGRNPQTGGHITLKAHRIVYFKPSKLLKDRVNKG
jgi:nucleoid DNA-binding protein